jgi:hypothetical protein
MRLGVNTGKMRLCKGDAQMSSFDYWKPVLRPHGTLCLSSACANRCLVGLGFFDVTVFSRLITYL